MATVQWSDYITFYSSFAGLLNASGLFGSQSVDFVVPQDSNYRWPINPPPFALIEPTIWPVSDDSIGGGRYSKTYTSNFKVHLVVNNIMDITFRDTNLVTSQSLITGTYSLVDNVINVLEQCYPTDITGKLTLVELPSSRHVAAPVRYQGSNQLSDVIITFYIKFCEKMLGTNFADAMPN